MTATGSLRRRLEHVGIAVTAVLAIAMIGLLTIDAFRSVPGIGVLYEQARIAGWWADHYLGTNVF